MPALIGIIGILLCLAGVHFLWLARHEILYWTDTYLLLFRRSFDAARRNEPAAPPPSPEHDELRAAHGLQERPRQRSEMWLMLSGLALVVMGLAATGTVVVMFVVRRLLS